ncbi:MAG: hypothetical protein JO292_10210 [Betaproteobacteria bacterium]|nr:hypothetical protein [Betaproteobacteria bacterium]MBV9361752.1 hypothetical protein [Betaproteobacteria bacterium]
MRWILPVVFAFSGSVEAQQMPGQIDPKGAAPGSGHGAAPQQTTAPSRNQFFSPVMGIQIEGQGLTLPKGVAEDPLAPPAVPQPAAEQKPAEQPPTTQK